MKLGAEVDQYQEPSLERGNGNLSDNTITDFHRILATLKAVKMIAAIHNCCTKHGDLQNQDITKIIYEDLNSTITLSNDAKKMAVTNLLHVWQLVTANMEAAV